MQNCVFIHCLQSGRYEVVLLKMPWRQVERYEWMHGWVDGYSDVCMLKEEDINRDNSSGVIKQRLTADSMEMEIAKK